jgi:hypothetical protein
MQQQHLHTRSSANDLMPMRNLYGKVDLMLVIVMDFFMFQLE